MTLLNANYRHEFLFLPESYGIKAKVWNPITGCPKLAEGKPCACPNGTPYCYMVPQMKRFQEKLKPEYRFHPDRIDQIKYSKPSLIGIGMSGDMWGWNDKTNEINKILYWIKEHTPFNRLFHTLIHFYLFLTKFPENYLGYDSLSYMDNIGIGTTVTRSDELHLVKTLKKVDAPMRYVVFEPLFGDWRGVDLSVLEGIDWVILGSVTGKNIKDWIKIRSMFSGHDYKNCSFYPPSYYLQPLIDKIEQLKIPTFMKKNFEFVPNEVLKQFPPQILEWAEKMRIK